MPKSTHTIMAESGSDNVFADLDLPHAEHTRLKAALTLQIYRTINQRCLTQAATSGILGLERAQASALMRNRSGMFSLERLIEFLTELDHDVEITVRPARRGRGRISVGVRA